MRIPNFKSEEGTILYKNTVGKLISPRVTEVLLSRATPLVASADLKTVLDLGCGPGTVCLSLAKAYPHLNIIAVDASDSMLAMASHEADQQGLSNIQFRKMDAGHVDLRSEAFDLILCNLAFPFFPRPYDSMHELFKTVRPGRGTWEEFFVIAESVLGEAAKMAKSFLVKFMQAEVLPVALSEAGFEQLQQSRTRTLLNLRGPCVLSVTI